MSKRIIQYNGMINMSAFLEKNLALIAGIILPVFLVLFLSITMFVIRNATALPEYDFIYMVDSYFPARVENNNRLMIDRLTEPPSPEPKLFVFDVRTNQSKQIKIDFSKPTLIQNKKSMFEILRFTDYRLDQNPQAPDGYNFNGNNSPIGLYKTEPYYHYRISKNGKNVLFDSNANYIQFVGWIIPNNKRIP